MAPACRKPTPIVRKGRICWCTSRLWPAVSTSLRLILPTLVWWQKAALRGYGQRDIIRFSTRIDNIGEKDYFIGIPAFGNPQFTYDNCHNHFHYDGYAEYLLFDSEGNSSPVGYKNGFCVLDLFCPNGGLAKYGCGNMGISVGCARRIQFRPALSVD